MIQWRRGTPILRLTRGCCDSAKKPDVSDLLKNATKFDLDERPDKWLTSAYHVDKRTRSALVKDIAPVKEKIDSSITTVILFPGQGSQFVGMAEDLMQYPNVKEIFDYGSFVMGYDIFKMCQEGPAYDLDMTINSQMAIFLTSLATLEKLKHMNSTAIDRCVATAGFSVGEFSALVFGGVLSFEDAAKLVKIRGEAMQICSEKRPSGMMTAFLEKTHNINYGLKLAREWCEEKLDIKDPVCQASNHLFPWCKVIGGDEQALQFLHRNCRDFGIKTMKRLPVSGAFHTALMRPAEDVLKRALDQVEVRKPEIQVISNYDCIPYSFPESIKKKLIKQISYPVNWEQIMHKLFQREVGSNFPNIYEVGPGESLRRILSRINKKAFAKCYKV